MTESYSFKCCCPSLNTNYDENLLERSKVISNLVWAGHQGHIIQYPPIHNVAKHGAYNLAQQCHYPSPKPLVARLEIKHLIHQKQHNSEWDVVISLEQEDNGSTHFCNRE